MNLFNKSIRKKKKRNQHLLASNSIPCKIANKNDWKRNEWREIRGTRTGLQRKTTVWNRYSMVRWRELRVQLDYPRCIWTGVFSNLFVPYKRPRARWGLRPTRRPRGLDLRTGPRRTFILSSLNVSFCQPPVIPCERLSFVPLSTRDFLRSFQRVTTGVFPQFTSEEKIIEIIGGYRESCRRYYCMIFKIFMRKSRY